MNEGRMPQPQPVNFTMWLKHELGPQLVSKQPGDTVSGFLRDRKRIRYLADGHGPTCLEQGREGVCVGLPLRASRCARFHDSELLLNLLGLGAQVPDLSL
jgi:hypothetical protein